MDINFSLTDAKYAVFDANSFPSYEAPVTDQMFNVLAWPFQSSWSIKLPLEYIHVPLIRRLCHKHINLTDFHQRRIEITESINKIVEEVCIRACRDIIMDPTKFVDQEGEQLWKAYINPWYINPYQANAAAAAAAGGGGGGFQVVEQFAGNLGFPHTGFQGNAGPQNIEEVLDDPEADISEMFSGIALVHALVNDTADVPPEDRTVFLTFSKGYYIPEEEIRDFFTSLFGDFIEDIFMQEVAPGVQPLYARMVCRSAATVYMVAPDGEKTKYSIRGRHVWAKKYEP